MKTDFLAVGTCVVAGLPSKRTAAHCRSRKASTAADSASKPSSTFMAAISAASIASAESRAVMSCIYAASVSSAARQAARVCGGTAGRSARSASSVAIRANFERTRSVRCQRVSVLALWPCSAFRAPPFGGFWGLGRGHAGHACARTCWTNPGRPGSGSFPLAHLGRFFVREY